jgi:hypothetical protein
LPYLAVNRRKLAREGKSEGERMICDLVDTVVGDIAHGNPAAARGVKVDVVDPNSVTDENFTFPQALYDFSRDRGPLHYHGICVPCRCNHIVFALAVKCRQFPAGSLYDLALDGNRWESVIRDDNLRHVKQSRTPLATVCQDIKTCPSH